MFGNVRPQSPAPKLPALSFGQSAGFVERAFRQRRLYLAAVVLLGVAVSAVGWTIWQLRNDAIRAAISDSGNIASILSGQLARSLDSIDAVLVEVEKSVNKAESDEPHDLGRMVNRYSFYESLTQYLTRLPWIFNIAIADQNGHVVVSTAAWPTPKVDVSDRDYFRDARLRPDGQLNASVPINNRINGTRTIVFSRRLEDANGKFLGIVYASVNSGYFENTYGSVKSINNLIFTLVREDGMILFRHPDPQGTAGRKLSAEATWLDSLSKGEQGFRVLAQADGNVRFVSSRAMPEYPLYVNISITENTALAGWRQRSAAIGLGSIILLICSLYLLIAFTRQVRRLSQSEASLAHMAHYDALTGLANRTLFSKKVNEAALRMQQSGQRFSILMLDLDRFKAVNDSLGHAVGDSLIRAVAERLRRVVDGFDNASRLGGDEFAIIHTAQDDQKGGAAALASTILAAVLEPYDLEGRKVVIGTSIGIALAPDDGNDADTIIRNADLALYKSKSEGRNRFRFFETSMEAEVRERRELEEGLSKAITREEFEVHYQTIIDIVTGEYCGAEALARWRHPTRGLIFPDQFISLAEESGLIVPLGEGILRKACADAAKWPAHIKLAVNLSPVQFKQGDLLGVVRSALADNGLSPDRLELEITETVLLEGDEEGLAVLHALKTMGVSVVLDDFGIGYSSMRYLQMFPFDKIKIDKSFIQSMTNRADSAAIVCAITSLARALEIKTTAEGVETAEQSGLLRSAGCQLAQGYLFSRPVPANELTFKRSEKKSWAAA